MRKLSENDGGAWTRRRFVGASLLGALFAGDALADTSPPRKGPSLFFSAAEATAMRQRFAEGFCKARWGLLLRNADALLTAPLITGAIDIGRTRPALGIIGTTAFAYALTGERRYAERARKEADALLAGDTWVKPSPGTRGANLATGEASAACALFYDWCAADTLSTAEREAFGRKLFDRGVAPYLASIDTYNDWWISNDVTNWSGVVSGGCGLAALALRDVQPEARRAAEYAAERVFRFLKTANRADGGGDEGVMYYTYGMLFGSYFAAAAERLLGTDGGVWDDASRKLSGYWLAYMQGPDGRYANFNDMSQETFEGLPLRNPEGGPNSTLCALWEAKAPGGDRLLAWNADRGGDTWYWRGASPFYLIFRSSRPAPHKSPALDNDVLFRESGQTLWKTPAFWFAFNGGWTSDLSHYNLDLGSFILVADGERLIHDPGYGKVATSDHSTLLVNGQGQKKGGRASYLRWGKGEKFRYLASDLTGAYDPATDLTRFVRHAVLLGDSCLVLIDEVAAREAVPFELRFQIKGEVQRNATGDSALVQGKKARLHLACAASRGGLYLEEGQAASTFLAVRTKEGTAATIFVTVLAPAVTGLGAPEVRIDPATGLVQVKNARGSAGEISLRFTTGSGGWTLSSVNKESAAQIGEGRERTLTSFQGRPATVG